MGQSIQLFVGADELLLANIVFDGINRLDLSQALGNAGGLGLEGFEDIAAGMRPALRVGQPGLLGIGVIRVLAIADENRIARRCHPQ